MDAREMDIETLKKNIDREWGYRRAEELRVERLRSQTHAEWVWGLDVVHSKVHEPDQNIFRVAAGVQAMLNAKNVAFCFIGGIPLQRWGETRYTKDVDLTVFCDLGTEDGMLCVLEKYLSARIEDATSMAHVARMYLSRSPEGVEVDVSLGFTPYERRMMERAVDMDFGVDVPLRICCAEDLVVTKTLAGRGQDWVDLQRVIQRSGDTMDWALVYEELEPLLAMGETDENLARLQEMVANTR